MIYFCVVFGASFGWTGGSHMRHLWLLGVVGGICCAARGRHAAAGALIALAAGLRVFPIFFAFGPACKAIADTVRRAAGASSRLCASSPRLVLTGWRSSAPPSSGRAACSTGSSSRRTCDGTCRSTRRTSSGSARSSPGTARPSPPTRPRRRRPRRARRGSTALQLAVDPAARRALRRRAQPARGTTRRDRARLAASSSPRLSLASYYYVFLVIYLLVRPLRRSARRLALRLRGRASTRSPSSRTAKSSSTSIDAFFSSTSSPRYTAKRSSRKRAALLEAGSVQPPRPGGERMSDRVLLPPHRSSLIAHRARPPRRRRRALRPAPLRASPHRRHVHQLSLRAQLGRRATGSSSIPASASRATRTSSSSPSRRCSFASASIRSPERSFVFRRGGAGHRRGRWRASDALRSVATVRRLPIAVLLLLPLEAFVYWSVASFETMPFTALLALAFYRLAAREHRRTRASSPPSCSRCSR